MANNRVFLSLKGKDGQEIHRTTIGKRLGIRWPNDAEKERWPDAAETPRGWYCVADINLFWDNVNRIVLTYPDEKRTLSIEFEDDDIDSWGGSDGFTIKS